MTKTHQTCDSELNTALDHLPGIGFFDDDIRAQLTETAKSISQDIVDLLGAQYREGRKPQTLPEGIWKPLRSRAYKIAAAHCEQLAEDLKAAAENPNTAL